MKEDFSSGILQMCCPEARQRCQQLHVAEITMNLESAVLSHTASSAHDILKPKIALIHCSSFLVVPSQQDVHTVHAGRCTALVCYQYADLATAGAHRHGHLFQAPEIRRETSLVLELQE